MPKEFVRIDATWLPNIVGIRTEYLQLTSTIRTLSNKLRVDTLAGTPTKRTWRVALSGLTPAQRESVRNLVLSDVGIRNVLLPSVGNIRAAVRIVGDDQPNVGMKVGNDFVYGGGRLEIGIEEE